jgi:EAL domain-containing protein (putative c-di-GMP-specific phosphodiesterase class I)
VAINVSPHQFAQTACVTRLQEHLHNASVSAHRIELEITESALLIDEAEAVDKIRQIQQMGVRMAIDDFGTGYSSLSRLARLPVNTIKIDISFVRRMLDDPPSGSIVESIIDIGRRFDLDIVAEGVENEAQLQFLQQRDCDLFQGFLFDRPLPAEEFEEQWLTGSRNSLSKKPSA